MIAENKNPHKPADSNVSVEDVNEFENHYLKNREIWDKAFDWLKSNDLVRIKTGKYAIDEDSLYAIVSEYLTKPIEDIMFEAHRKYIDIQYVVSGKEMMGVAELDKAIEKVPFNEEKDIAFYEVPEADCRYYVAGPDKYFIFFPGDAHRPGIRVGEGEMVKKIVVKLIV